MIPSPDKHFGLNLRLSGENLSPRVTVYVTIANGGLRSFSCIYETHGEGGREQLDEDF